ncbi:hypothetical protein [Sphingorhabdus sp.]|uniref:hypothetical protein n=1 Tax=Sphingorhabdus sp. TaxID=1902408 RepID=UPI0032B800AC
MTLTDSIYQIIKTEFEKEPVFEEEFIASTLNALISLKDDLQGRLPLPEKAPVTYLKRDKYQYDFGCDPIAFMNHYYGPYIKAKVMYQDQLHALDPTLAMSIHSHCYRMKRDYPERAHEFNALDYLPPSRERRTEWLAQISDALLALKTKEVIAARNSMRSRKKPLQGDDAHDSCIS